MRKNSEIVEDKFNKKWVIYKTGFTDLVKKMNDENHIIRDKFIIAQVHRAVLTNKYIFENYKKNGTKIIEAACGNGFNTCYLVDKGYDAKGFDTSSNGINDAKKLLSSLDKSKDIFEVNNHTYFENIENESIDVVIALGLMRYLREDDLDYIYKEVYRILRSKGTFILTNDNLLFDLFALNDGTIKFWANAIDSFSDAKKLLPGNSIVKSLEDKINLPKRKYSPHSVSKYIEKHVQNPLTYSKYVDQYGFKLKEIVYPDCHLLPPALENSVDIEELQKLKAEICLKKSRDLYAMFMDDEFLSFLVK